MPAVLAANLVEVLATLTAGGNALSLFFVMLIMKTMVMRRRHGDLADDAKFLEFNHGWYFFVAWGSACASFALMFPLIFQEIYESMDMIDSATTVLTFLVLYMMMMLLWVYVQYIASKRKTASNTYAYAFVFLSFACAVVVTVLVFATLHENPWYHYLVLVLYIGPVFAIFATNSASTYRELHVSTEHFVPASPVFAKDGMPAFAYLAASNGPFMSGDQ